MGFASLNPSYGDAAMSCQTALGSLVLAAVLIVTAPHARAADESKYPDWSGQWRRVADGGVPRYDPSKPLRKQEAPLTPEYQALHEASIKDQDAGGHGLDEAYKCMPQGMPRQMSGVFPFEFVIGLKVTYVLFEYMVQQARRIYTDGRDFPKDEDPTFAGYSIGKWIDENGDGRFDTLEIETRSIKLPHTYDATGVPFHEDGEGVVKERIYLDKADANIIHDEITSIDHALTRPWTVTKTYRRDPKVKEPVWRSAVCASDNSLVRIGEDAYFTSPDGYLMPIKKNQPPPDLRYFNRTQK